MNVFVVILMGAWMCWEALFGKQYLLPIGFILLYILILLMEINENRK